MLLECINVYETVIAFSAGLFVMCLLCFFARLKRKTVLVLFINSLLGAAVYIIFASGGYGLFFLNVFLCGVGGIPVSIFIFLF